MMKNTLIYNLTQKTITKTKHGEKLNLNQKFFSNIGFNYLILAVLTIAIQIVGVNIIHLINGDILNNFNFAVIFSAICNYILPLPIFLYLMKRLERDDIEKNNVNVKTFISYIAITMTLMWIGNTIGIFITTGLGVLISNDISNPIQDLISTSDMWLNLILISIIAPIFEEFIFRKLLIDRTIKYGVRVSIIISATMFAFYHGNLNQFFYAFLMGGFFAYVYAKTGKIHYTIALHIIINFLGSVASPILAVSLNALQSGTETPTDIGLILVYAIIYLIALTIATFKLCRYKEYKTNGAKTRINLDKPFRTMFINYGMICFIGFFAFRIMQQILS